MGSVSLLEIPRRLKLRENIIGKSRLIPPSLQSYSPLFLSKLLESQISHKWFSTTLSSVWTKWLQYLLTLLSKPIILLTIYQEGVNHSTNKSVHTYIALSFLKALRRHIT